VFDERLDDGRRARRAAPSPHCRGYAAVVGQHPGAAPIIGAIAPVRAERGGADFNLAELTRQLPVLIWLVDAPDV